MATVGLLPSGLLRLKDGVGVVGLPWSLGAKKNLAGIGKWASGLGMLSPPLVTLGDGGGQISTAG